MDPRRLELLLELSRLGSMRAVAEAMHVTTSTVSQQIAALAREAGTPLTEPQGRRVRLTPAGRRLAGHAVSILAAIDAARADLGPAAPPAGTLRVAAFATAVRRVLLPVAGILAARYPAVRLHIHEHEPAEALGLLAGDDVDLALTYDYNLALAGFGPGLAVRPLGATRWSLAVPAGPAGAAAGRRARGLRASSATTTGSSTPATPPTTTWSAPSPSLAGFQPRITHRADSLRAGPGHDPGRPRGRAAARRTAG